MTLAQASLLKRLIQADRSYRSRLQAGETAHPNERGVEVGFAADPRVVRVLDEAGLIEVLDPGINGHPFAYLGRYEPFDEV